MSHAVASKAPSLSSNVKMVGRYTVLRELRRDRYTAVYLALDPVLNRELIVKAVQLHPSQSQDRAAHERVEQAFMRQAQAAGRLHHAHIVTVFDAGHVNHIGYLALEKVDGKLLDELLAEGFRPGFLQAADIAARVADAIEFAHARGIPHGHLSPSRIYLQGAERLPKVMGFGGWIDSGSTGDFELHATDRMLPYFGNELSGEARRKDVRALGALLFLLLTGARPDAKLLAQRKGSESPILLLKPTAPLALAEIAEQALELGGKRVFANAAQVRNALTTYLWGNRADLPMPGSATITGMPARVAVMPKRAATLTVGTLVPVATQPEPESRGWYRHAVAGLVGVAAIALIGGLALRSSENADRPSRGSPAVTPATPTAGVRFAPLPGSPRTGVSAHAAELSSTTAPAERPANARAGASGRSTAVVPASGAPHGTVALAVVPWGTVYINGESRGTTPPLTELSLPAGRYLIEIRNGDQPPFVEQIDVAVDQTQQIRHRFQ